MPTGTVTFLLTDIEGSSRLWEEHPTAMAASVARHDEIIGEVVAASGGTLLKDKGEGDSTFAVFGRASDALAAALASQLALVSEAWPTDVAIRVRMAVHTGEAELRDGDYYGAAVNRTARLREMAHGGQVLCSQGTADLAGGMQPKLELVDLGEHRLRDLARPERVLQLVHPSLRREFPPLRSLEAIPNNLPVQLTSFVGRQSEMEELEDLLTTHRLLTLTGAAGSGKTRLALQAAARLLPDQRDGAWLVELGGLADAGAVEEAVASALGISQQAGETLVETVGSYLRNKQMLLLLDNCEHLLNGVTRVVESVLAIAPNVRVLATSREPLAVRGERVLGVPSLPVPDETADATGVGAVDAVELFVERARAARAGFVLTPDNADAVAQLCRRLDGIPLAIELAAARVRSMAPAEIAARLDQRFRLLTGSARSAVSRHQTLRRAIDWSYQLLEETERVLLGRLSVCLGGFELDAAEYIGTGGAIDDLDVDDILSRLVDKSLVVAEDRGGSTRYRMLETIRAYAFEELEEAAQVDVVRHRHAEHYAAFAVDAGAGLKGPAERAWLARVEDDLDNLRAAVMWSLDGDDPSPALAVVTALSLTGVRIEPVVGAWAASVVACPAAEEDIRYPAALAFLAWTTLRQGRGDEATRLADEAITALDRTPEEDPMVVSRVLCSTAAIHGSVGRDPTDQALRWVSAARRAGDGYLTSLALNMLAVGRHINGDEGAVTSAEESLAMARTSGSPSAMAYCSFTAAMVMIDRDPARASALLDEALRFADAAANDYAVLVAVAVRNSALSKAGKHDEAASAFRDSAQRCFAYGHRAQQAINVWCIGGCLAVVGYAEPAAVLGGWALSILRNPLDGGGQDPSVHTLNLNLHPDAMTALSTLPAILGEDRCASLTAMGAAMNDEEVLRYADQQISPAGGAPASKAVPASSLPNAFRREGDTWLIDYEGQSCRLRDAKGLRYLAVLLARPGREVHVADLAGVGDLPTSGVGPRLDTAARDAYKARIAELEDEIDEASTWSDDERAARARAELDAIAGELTAAYGIGGRAREEADPVERIRKAVTNRIRDAIGRLEAEHPALGRHLRNGIRTGTFCSYAPEREKSWEVP